MSLSKDLLIELFERLPILPLTQIAASVNNPHDLIKLAFRFEKWRRAIGSREIKRIRVKVMVNESDCEVRTKGCSLLEEPEKELSFMVRNDENCSHKKNLIETFNFLDLCSTYFFRLQVDNAEWMRLSDLLKINCCYGTFGSNRLKSRELRVFLYHWINGISWENARHLKLQLSQQQAEEIDMSEVLEGLNAVPWNPRARDRKFVVWDSDSQVCLPSIDLRDGNDIRHSNSDLATIFLDPNTLILHFCVWNGHLFIMDFLDYEQHVKVVLANQKLAENLESTDREKYEIERKKQLESLRNLRNDPKLEVNDLTYVERNVAFY